MPEGVGYGANNPSGTGKSLNYIDDGIWAGWSGLIDPNNTTQEAFNFKSPQVPLMTNLTWTVNMVELTANRSINLEVKINGESVIYHAGQITAAGDFPGSFPANIGPFVIPPNSEVIVTLGTNEDANVDQHVTLAATGRVIPE